VLVQLVPGGAARNYECYAKAVEQADPSDVPVLSKKMLRIILICRGFNQRE
jgi:hypothetical protein